MASNVYCSIIHSSFRVPIPPIRSSVPPITQLGIKQAPVEQMEDRLKDDMLLQSAGRLSR